MGDIARGVGNTVLPTEKHTTPKTGIKQGECNEHHPSVYRESTKKDRSIFENMQRVDTK